MAHNGAIPAMDLSVVLPVINERENLDVLIPRLRAMLKREAIAHEIIVVDGGSTDGTRQTAAGLGARVVAERRRGYTGALETGFAEARGEWVLTLDADLSHDPDFVPQLWSARTLADIVIASRYARGGAVRTAWHRRALSRILNEVLHRVLAMPVRDLSSGFRLYRASALQGLEFDSTNYEVLEEILVKAYVRGANITEVPFTYLPRASGRSHTRVLAFGWSIIRSAFRLSRLRRASARAS
ncbi:MAG: glycosyltransferase [Candidatus Binataceae bacterium]